MLSERVIQADQPTTRLLAKPRYRGMPIFWSGNPALNILALKAALHNENRHYSSSSGSRNSSNDKHNRDTECAEKDWYFHPRHTGEGRGPSPCSPCLCGEFYFTSEKLVGCRIWFSTRARIAPFFSVSARALIHSGSAWKAFHFFSRSASDSHFRK